MLTWAIIETIFTKDSFRRNYSLLVVSLGWLLGLQHAIPIHTTRSGDYLRLHQFPKVKF